MVLFHKVIAYFPEDFNHEELVSISKDTEILNLKFRVQKTT